VVLAFDYAAAGQVIHNGVNGILADCNNPTSFINQSAELMNAHLELDVLRKNARQTTLDLSWKSVTARLNQNYHDLLHSHAPQKNSSKALSLSEACSKL
jgi:hypothetical protein